MRLRKFNLNIIELNFCEKYVILGIKLQKLYNRMEILKMVILHFMSYHIYAPRTCETGAPRAFHRYISISNINLKKTQHVISFLFF